ncbi:HD-GYP domain-containing protein [Terrilactibacillus laevilacticus]|uniref:HD-GYP domain-containing protein n=1 Tax=Terrilactibacillus laevilacticus TaxID=1380157 RepID=A0ABW5PNZ1_9BACI|nr:HD domain-containing phosphohydrolase [Terrilactibacillus laevilacticus]
MRVPYQSLIEGCILKQAVYSKSTRPLIPKGTIINTHHLKVLKGFLIPEVEIETYLDNGERFQGKRIENRKNHFNIKDKAKPKSIEDFYQQAVSGYARSFSQWQGGTSIHMSSIRQDSLPLLRASLERTDWIALKLIQGDFIHDGTQRAIGMGILSAFLANKLNYDYGDLLQIGIGGILANCGLAKLSPSILSRYPHLKKEEKMAYDQHPIQSYKMLKTVSTIKEGVCLGILEHHEYGDGSGYPLKLTRDKLHEFSYIYSTVETFLSLMKKEKPIDALINLNKNYLFKLNTPTLEVFTVKVMELFLGYKVLLSNGQTGEISYIPSPAPTEPFIKTDHDKILVLNSESNIKIEKILVN